MTFWAVITAPTAINPITKIQLALLLASKCSNMMTLYLTKRPKLHEWNMSINSSKSQDLPINSWWVAKSFHKSYVIRKMDSR